MEDYPIPDGFYFKDDLDGGRLVKKPIPADVPQQITDARFIELTNRLNSLDMSEVLELELAYNQFVETHRFSFETCTLMGFLDWVRESRTYILGTPEQIAEIRAYREKSREIAERQRKEDEARKEASETRAKRTSVAICVDDLDARDDPTRSARIACYSATPSEIEFLLGLVRRLREKSDVALQQRITVLEGAGWNNGGWEFQRDAEGKLCQATKADVRKNDEGVVVECIRKYGCLGNTLEEVVTEAEMFDAGKPSIIRAVPAGHEYPYRGLGAIGNREEEGR